MTQNVTMSRVKWMGTGPFYLLINPSTEPPSQNRTSNRSRLVRRKVPLFFLLLLRRLLKHKKHYKMSRRNRCIERKRHQHTQAWGWEEQRHSRRSRNISQQKKKFCCFEINKQTKKSFELSLLSFRGRFRAIVRAVSQFLFRIIFFIDIFGS